MLVLNLACQLLICPFYLAFLSNSVGRFHTFAILLQACMDWIPTFWLVSVQLFHGHVPIFQIWVSHIPPFDDFKIIYSNGTMIFLLATQFIFGDTSSIIVDHTHPYYWLHEYTKCPNNMVLHDRSYFQISGANLHTAITWSWWTDSFRWLIDAITYYYMVDTQFVNPSTHFRWLYPIHWEDSWNLAARSPIIAEKHGEAQELGANGTFSLILDHPIYRICCFNILATWNTMFCRSKFPNLPSSIRM